MSLSREQKKEHLVFGFVRSYFLTLNIVDLPPNDLLLLLISWFSIGDEWDNELKSKGIEMINNGTEVYNNGNHGCWQTAFAKQECLPNTGKYEWILELTKYQIDTKNTIQMMIGICGKDNLKKLKDDSTGPNSWIYCFYSENKRLQQFATPGIAYGEKFTKIGDTMVIHLDTDNLTLSYSINDKFYGNAFQIKKDVYRFIVCMCKDRSVQLL